jgi:hypothetical protein
MKDLPRYYLSDVSHLINAKRDKRATTTEDIEDSERRLNLL